MLRGPLTKRIIKHGKGPVILLNYERSTTPSNKMRAPKKKMVSTRIFRETGCNPILVRFLLANHPQKALPCFIVRFVSGPLKSQLGLV
jgi:hypothetical protein